MNFGKSLRCLLFVVLATAPGFLAGGCGGGGGGSSANSIASAVQDLTADAEGTTTVITFGSASGLSTATAANFAADGGQTAQSLVVVGNVATVTWDARVSPSHHVGTTGLSGVSTVLHAVTTSDASVPTFTISSATQNPGLGGDTISVTFAGPHVVETEAEDLTNFVLVTDAQTLDLTGSTFSFDVPTQVLDITLGVSANLHATFTLAAPGLHSVADVALSATPVAGNATGDTTAPTIVSAIQNLAQDEYGRVVDFTFSEAMDPVFSTATTHFVVALPDLATTVEQPTEDVLRVTFNNPIVPGVDSVTLTSLVDLHGNAFPDEVRPITQPSPVVNAFSGNVQAVTVANAGGDYVTATTTQALDPDSALLPASWSLVVAGNPIDLSTQTFTYDFLGKTLRIDLDVDLVNGQAFTLQGVGALDVDGDLFTLSQSQTVSGESTLPVATGGVQNRSVDPTGVVVDVQMSEDVEITSAETLANWASGGLQNVVSATLQPSLDVVRLVFDAPMIPGDDTVSVQNVQDLAGNVLVLQTGVALTSTDTTAPTVVTFEADANEGANNDVIELVLDDNLVVGDVTDTSRWTLESPTGTARSTAGATVLYDDAAKRARLKLVNGENLHRGDDFKVSLTGVRDLGGNALSAIPVTGPVIAETTIPYVHTVWRPTSNNGQLEVRFSEPCALLTDLYNSVTNPSGTRYVLRTSGGVLRGYATAASSIDDGLAARVSFGIVVAASDTLDVIGPTDLVGNPLFATLAQPSVAEDLSVPSLALGLSTLVSVSGEADDVITVQFAGPVSPWTITDHVHYTVTGPSTIVKRTRDLTFDGLDTITIPIRSNSTDYDLLFAQGYDLELDGVLTAQGVPMAAPQTESGILVSGDSTPPNVLAGKVRLDPSNPNALLVEFTEAVGPPSATSLASYDYDAGTSPIAATLVNGRVARITFAAPPLVGHSLSVDVQDRAGNASGTIVRTVSAVDATPPLVASVDGLIRSGWGNDEVHVFFDEPVSNATALTAANYTVTSGGVARTLTGSLFTYTSATNEVTIRLASGQDLAAAGPLSVTVAGIRDVSSNLMPTPVVVGGATTGDTTPPAMTKAFVNLHTDATGKVVDVLFSEDVDQVFAGNAAHWTASGGVTVSAVDMRERNHARLTLSAALAGAGTLQLTGLPDVAGNASGSISIDPVE